MNRKLALFVVAALAITAVPFVLAEDKPAGTPTTKPASTIDITSPDDGAEVGHVVLLEGIIRVEDMGDRVAVVLVHPMLTDLLWVQPLPANYDKVANGYRFRTRAFCGTEDKGKGEKFELTALLVKKGTVNQGDKLTRVPDDASKSLTILVTRTK